MVSLSLVEAGVTVGVVDDTGLLVSAVGEVVGDTPVVIVSAG